MNIFATTQRVFGFLLLTILLGGVFLEASLHAQLLSSEEAYEKNIARHYFFGVEEFRFFMTPEELREKISEVKLATGVTIVENDSDIYADPRAVTQDFVYYHPYFKNHYPFSVMDRDMGDFLDTIVRKELDSRIYHLTKRYSGDFKLMTIPASIENDRPWEFSFVFFNQREGDGNVYRLFSISIAFKGNNEGPGTFAPVSENFFKRIRNKIYDKYGTPDKKGTTLLGKGNVIEKNYETFLRHYKSDQYIRNSTNVGNFSLPVQITLSYTTVVVQLRNLQISYVAADYINELIFDFTTSQANYQDVDIDNDIKIEF